MSLDCQRVATTANQFSGSARPSVSAIPRIEMLHCRNALKRLSNAHNENKKNQPMKIMNQCSMRPKNRLLIVDQYLVQMMGLKLSELLSKGVVTIPSEINKPRLDSGYIPSLSTCSRNLSTKCSPLRTGTVIK